MKNTTNINISNQTKLSININHESTLIMNQVRKHIILSILLISQYVVDSTLIGDHICVKLCKHMSILFIIVLIILTAVK